ncbi:hypothetical protein ACFJGW_00910 [Burkholderiaceae bacterium UC74_6]
MFADNLSNRQERDIKETMTSQIADFQPMLKAAISEARAAGFEAAAAQLEEAAFAAYGTSSELLGETGIAIRAFVASVGTAAPSAVVDKLDRCLVEVRKVWPSM